MMCSTIHCGDKKMGLVRVGVFESLLSMVLRDPMEDIDATSFHCNFSFM